MSFRTKVPSGKGVTQGKTSEQLSADSVLQETGQVQEGELGRKRTMRPGGAGKDFYFSSPSFSVFMSLL